MEAAAGPGWEYRPHLDGLRALAVYLVVGFHAGVSGLAGGFVGVDVFFVLSGYLVTNLLLRDLDGEGGRVRFGRFYSRRARRLLPAAVINLVVTAVVFRALGSSVELADATEAIRAAALYFANWHFVAQSTDYFAADVEASPVLHYWSLAVEEQFYLLWPLALGGLYALGRRFGGSGRRRRGAVRLVVAGAGLASLATAVLIEADRPAAAYYGTHTRMYQLLAGAVLALTPAVVVRLRASPLARAMPVASVLVAVALVVAATPVLDVSPVKRGAVVTLLVVTLLAALESAPAGVGRRLLSWAPLVYLGRISYGTYLWHWPVVVVLAHRAELGPGATVAVAGVVSTGLASLSHQLLELPVRTAPALDRRRAAVLGTAVVVSLLVGLVVVPRVLDHRPSPSLAVESGGSGAVGGPVPTAEEIRTAWADVYRYGDCRVSGPVACPLTSGSGSTAIVVGESHAGMITPMLQDLARRHDVSLYGGYLSYCPWTRGLRYSIAGRDCFEDQARVFDRIIPELDPDIVFLMHRPVDDANSGLPLTDEDEGLLGADPERRAAALRKRVPEVVRALRADGRTVVMFEPIPVVKPDDDTLRCLSRAETTAECRFVTRVGPGDQERVMRDLAADDPAVVSVDLDPLVCPYSPICDPVVGGRIVKRDDNHLTITFVRSLLDPVDELLTGEGVFR